MKNKITKRQSTIFEIYKYLGLKQKTLVDAMGKSKSSIFQYTSGTYNAPEEILEAATKLIYQELENNVNAANKRLDYVNNLQAKLIQRLNNAMMEDAKTN